MISPKCLFGHDWNEEIADVSTEREDVEQKKTVKRCSQCGKEKEIKRETQVSISAAEQAYQDDSNQVRTDGGNNDDSVELGSPFENVDEEKMEDDAIIIDGDNSSDSDMGSSMGENQSNNQSNNEENADALNEELSDDNILTPSGSNSSGDKNSQKANKSDDAEIITAGEGEQNNTQSDDSSSSTTLPEQNVTEPDTITLVCERCSYQTTTNEGTLRGGDVCPNCSVEFLEER